MTSLSLCGRHFKEKGKWVLVQENVREGGREMPAIQETNCFLHYKHQPGVSSLKVQKAEILLFTTTSFEQEIDWKTLLEKYVPYFISMTTNFGQTTK